MSRLVWQRQHQDPPGEVAALFDDAGCGKTALTPSLDTMLIHPERILLLTWLAGAPPTNQQAEAVEKVFIARDVAIPARAHMITSDSCSMRE